MYVCARVCVCLCLCVCTCLCLCLCLSACVCLWVCLQMSISTRIYIWPEQWEAELTGQPTDKNKGTDKVCGAGHMEGLEEAIEEPRPPMLTERGNDDCNDSPLSWECPGVRGAGMHAHVHMSLHLHAALPESHSTYRPACVRKIAKRMRACISSDSPHGASTPKAAAADKVRPAWGHGRSRPLSAPVARPLVCVHVHACMHAGEEGRSLTQLLSLFRSLALSHSGILGQPLSAYTPRNTPPSHERQPSPSTPHVPPPSSPPPPT